MSEEVVCSSCEQQKERLHAVKSKLVGSQLYMCSTCLENGFEPRWAIILAGRTFGPAQIHTHIKNRKYVGKDILATEVFK